MTNHNNHTKLELLPLLMFFILCYHLYSTGDTNKIVGTLDYTRNIIYKNVITMYGNHIITGTQ
jgi:hypothetical protein